MQAAPFLADSRNLSVDPLALLITAPIPEDSWGGARVSSYRFPAIYAPTKEALLVSGAILQLGDEDVQPATGSLAEVDCVDTVTCRLSLYRDECTLQWSQVAEAPLRAMIQGIPALRVCRDPSCDQSCALFHPAVDETVEQLFLDAWSRNFCRATGGKAKPSDAELFQIFVRAPQSALLHLFRASVAGLYVEPRAADGSPHSAWAVVWLPGMSQAQAAHALRTQAKAISLVRLGHKFGLRTKEVDEQVVFEALRPSHSFVKLRIIAHWRLHPLSFGFQRSSITQLLKQWGWNARPLQPAKKNSEGCAWIVGAAVEPPAQTQPLGSTFVRITKVRDVGVRRAEVAKVCASQRTKKHMLLEDDPDVEDPWANGQDPWSAARTGVELSALQAGANPGRPTDCHGYSAGAGADTASPSRLV